MSIILKLLLLLGVLFFIFKKIIAGLNIAGLNGATVGRVSPKSAEYFRGFLSDAKYDAYVKGIVETKNLTQEVALSKFDLDESEFNELPPVCLSDYYFDEKTHLMVKKGKDEKWRSSAYQVSWLFFSSEQVCVYQYTLNFRGYEENRVTKQYFWKEIVAFNTFEGSKTVIISPKNAKENKTETVILKLFSLIVPGDELVCAMPNDDSFDKTIRGMKATLKAKKEG